MFTHHTPATLDARPNYLKLSESAFLQRGAAMFRELIGSQKSWLHGSLVFTEVLASRRSGPRAKTLKGVGKENARANQAQKRCNNFDHRKYPLAPVLTKRPPCCTVKRNPSADRRSELTEDSAQQVRQKDSAPTRRDGSNRD
jgi:hypothetical protein